MAGHSKWNNIMHKKGANDALRAKSFQKISKEISNAVKLGKSGKVEDNPSLRLVIEKARAENMPKDVIERAINKALGAGEDDNSVEVFYEGYGKDGVAFLLAALTDNKNRTASEVRTAFNRNGGALGESGSVSYLFNRKGVLVFEKGSLSSEDFLEVSLTSEVLDTDENEETYIVYTEPDKLISTKENFVKEGISNFLVSEVGFVPDVYIKVEGDNHQKNIDLRNALDNLDDVLNVYDNME